MKKFLTIITVLIALLNISALTVSAEEYEYDFSEVYGSLSDEAREHMLSIGADSADANALSNLSFDNIMSEIEGIAADGQYGVRCNRKRLKPVARLCADCRNAYGHVRSGVRLGGVLRFGNRGRAGGGADRSKDNRAVFEYVFGNQHIGRTFAGH